MSEAQLKTLAGVPMLSGLSRRQLRRVLDRMSEHHYKEGASIVRRGMPGEGLFLLTEGNANVVRGGRTVAKLAPGEFFGEVAVLDRRPRTADVIAASPVTALVLHREDLRKILATEPRAAWSLLETLAGRLRGD
jgi:CRP-like cAMP-binding protein